MSDFHNEERRTAYRVQLESQLLLEVSLVLPAGQLLSGSLIDINVSGAAASFLADELPDLAPNDKVKLKFATPINQKTFVTDAVVKGLTATQKKRICRFKFADPDSFVHKLGKFLVKYYFNRRQFPRRKCYHVMDGEVTLDSEARLG
jgi:hypothetical protein